MNYRTITRGLTLMTLAAGFFTGFLMQACEEDSIRTAAGACLFCGDGGEKAGHIF